MKKPHERWTTKQTHQGTWVMEDNGRAFGPESKAVAMVYLPEAHEVAGATFAERVTNAEALALSHAKKMAAANDMADALLEARAQFRMQMEGDPRWHRKGGVEALSATIDAALRKAGVLP